MLVELKTKSQIKIPKKIVVSLGLSEGDILEAFEREVMICLMPVSVYSKNLDDELHNEIKDLKEGIKNGRTPVFNNIDSLFDCLENS